MSRPTNAAGQDMRPRISVYLITKNEAINLPRTLSNLDWADELVVVDSGSTDDTVAIAQSYGAKVSNEEFHGFGPQKNFALDQCTGDWLLNIDADEEITPELRDSILATVSDASPSTPSLYCVTRRTWYLGAWISHCGWYPEYRTRLSRKGQARWTDEPVHEHLEGHGPLGTLSGDLLHRPYRDLGDHIRTIDRYSALFAEREAGRGKTSGLGAILFRPVGRFLRMYVARAGFLDGMPGLIASLMGAWYVFLKHARLYERTKVGLR